MQPVSLLSDVTDIDDAFLDAIAQIAGTRDILFLRTWNGVDPVTLEMPDEERQEAAIYVERYRRPGRYGLDVSIFGLHRMTPNMSEAQFIRCLALSLRRPMVSSDCHANPWSWFRFNADGSIEQVYTVPDGDGGEPLYDLACDLPPNHTHFLPAKSVWAADRPLPQKPDDAPEHLPRALQIFCDDVGKAGLCINFWSACPYRMAP